MTRFVKYSVHETHLQSQIKEDVIGHFAANSDEMIRSFPNWEQQLVFIASTDKSDEYLKLLTDGQFTKISDGENDAAISGKYPIIIMDSKYKLLNLVADQKLDPTVCVRFGLLKANAKAPSSSKSMVLIKLGLNQPTQADVNQLSSKVDPTRLKEILQTWPTSVSSLLQLPQFTNAPKPEPKPSIVPPPFNPSAPTSSELENSSQENRMVLVAESRLNEIENRMNQLDLNSNTSVMMAGTSNQASTTSEPPKVVLSKTIFAVPQVDLDVDGSMAEALDSMVSLTRLVDVKSHKNLILQFLTTNSLTDVIHDLTDEQLSSIRKFQDAMLERYGSHDPVADFTSIKQRAMEDPSSLLNRVQRAWRRVMKMEHNAKIPAKEHAIVRDRFIKALRSEQLQTNLQIWNTPYEKLVDVARDYRKAMKGKKDESTTNGDVMIAFEGCEHCGMAHASSACRANPKQKTSWNKKKKYNRPVSRSPARIIPDEIGSDNRYQPVQRNLKKPFRRNRYPRNGKKVRFDDEKPKQNWNSSSQKRNNNWRGSNRKQDNRRNGTPKYYNRRSTQAYLAMDNYETDYEYPFQSGVEENRRIQYA